MQSEPETPPEKNPPPADSRSLTFITPFLSQGEPSGNKEETLQDLGLYDPGTGQPGFARKGTMPGQGAVVTYDITSDTVPEPSTLLLLVMSLAGLAWKRKVFKFSGRP
jgi:hypothetical protein